MRGRPETGLRILFARLPLDSFGVTHYVGLHGVCSFGFSGSVVAGCPNGVGPIRFHHLLVARQPAQRVATHVYAGEQTPLCLSSKAILTRPLAHAMAFKV